MAAESRETLDLLRQHLAVAGAPDESRQVWTLAPSSIAGRGVVATQDIAAGELIFIDVPLVVGPRAGKNSPPVCVGCHEGPSQLVACSLGCGLPVCSAKCETSAQHRQECERLRSWKIVNGRSWSPDLLRALTPVDVIKRNSEIGPNQEDEEFMRLACCVMDANAFETARLYKTSENEPIVATEETRPLSGMGPSLRGLYPLAAMMNHVCTPNTRHSYDDNYGMAVHATVNIPKGTEITNSYTALLWGTPARRHQLEVTKHFQCACPRCADPQEGGSRLSALKCLTQTCQGAMFSVNSLDEEADWACEICGRRMTGRKAALIQCNLGRLLGVIDCTNPVHMERFLKEHHQIAPSTNQIVVEVKCSLIRTYGHRKGYMWQGLLLYELHCTMMELYRRRRDMPESKPTRPNIVQEALAVIQESVEILNEDITGPLDLTHRLKVCKEIAKIKSYDISYNG
ncbi:hypothetical protein C0J52_09247 [Blattella germanica]|nr:hypothetical protein C0J52_09247 [Blattella germanica]